MNRQQYREKLWELARMNKWEGRQQVGVLSLYAGDRSWNVFDSRKLKMTKERLAEFDAKWKGNKEGAGYFSDWERFRGRVANGTHQGQKGIHACVQAGLQWVAANVPKTGPGL